MSRSAFSTVMWVGRATVFMVGLAVVLALLFGVATTALGATGGNFILGQSNAAAAITRLVGNVPGGSALQVSNPSAEAGSRALQLGVSEGKAPLMVNAAAGTATHLSADELDGEDSEQILPLVRAQKDPTPFLSDTVTGSNAQTNSVSINAPTDGVLMIFGSMWLYNPGTEDQYFTSRIRVDGEEETHVDVSGVGPNKGANLTPNVTLPVSAGQHTVGLDAGRSGGSGNWSYTSNNLTVMFVPAGRAAMTGTP